MRGAFRTLHGLTKWQVGRGEGETAASWYVLVDPLTLTLSPSEGERETIACDCGPSHGFLSKEGQDENPMPENRNRKSSTVHLRSVFGHRISFGIRISGFGFVLDSF